MRNLQGSGNAVFLMALVLVTGGLLVAGCGGDAAAPKPKLEAMGGILIARGLPAGTPYQAGVVVTVDNQVVTDAEVSINGTRLQYVNNPAQPEATGYVGLIPVPAGGTLTLSVTAAGQTLTQDATVPGMVEILAPTPGAAFADNADIPVSWTPSAGAALSIVSCSGTSSPTPGVWLLPGSAGAYNVPAGASTTPGSRITVIGLSGTGDIPTSLDLRQWPGMNGFWVSCQDHVDVQITG